MNRLMTREIWLEDDRLATVHALHGLRSHWIGYCILGSCKERCPAFIQNCEPSPDLGCRISNSAHFSAGSDDFAR